MRSKTKQCKNAAVYAFLACCLFMVSCSDIHDNAPTDDNPVPASFNANISAPITRATGTSWELNDEVGIFMLKSGGTLATTADVLAVNKQYQVTGNSQPIDDAKDNLKPKSEAEAIYLQPGVPFDFVAYYPWKATASLTDGTKYPVSLANQVAGSAPHDLLYATASRTNVKSNAISMVFGHKLTNITIQVVRGKGVNAAAYLAKQAVLKGMPTVASFDLSDGTTLSDIGTVADITSSRADAAGNLFELIVIPQTVGTYKSRMISFTGLGKDYLWSIPDGFTFESGKRYTYRFTITEGGLELAGDVIIEPWTAIDLSSSGSWTGGVADILDIETVDIQPGTFMMGDVDIAVTSPVHQVTLTKGFKMSKYQITTSQYCEFLNIIGAEGEVCKTDATLFSVYGADGKEWIRSSNGTNSDWGIHWDGIKWVPASGFENHPITSVSISGATAFCDFVKGSLPTEAQWEYACRAGTTTKYYFGTNDAEVANHAWYDGNNTPVGPKAVGQKQSNPWGLYDMYGNIWEWTLDLYNSDYYTEAPVVDPINTDIATPIADAHTVRGGSYSRPISSTTSAYRGYDSRDRVRPDFGFRPIFPL